MSFYYRPSLIKWNNGTDLILSDHGRSPLEIGTDRIENRERMANGRMRSKWIADKETFSLSWELLPSRSVVNSVNVVADGYSSATDLYNFYKSTPGEFQMTVYSDDGTAGPLASDEVFGIYQVFFSDFSMTIGRRGKEFDFMNVSLSLEQA